MLTNRIGIISLLMGGAFLLQSCRESTLYPNRNPGPGTNPTDLAIADVYGVEWELEAFEVRVAGSLGTEYAVPSGQRYTLTFRQDGLGGDNDCNVYGGEYTLKSDNGISIANIISTQAECSAASRDGEFAAVLAQAIRYEISATTLRILAEDRPAIDFNSGGVQPTALRFRRVKSPAVQLVQMEVIDLAASDPYSILNAVIDGDMLRLTVRYSGGCNEHGFNLMGPLTIPAGDPTDVTLLLHHNAKGDACEALITRDLVFDLTPLKERWKSVTGRTSGVISVLLGDLLGGTVGPMSYIIGNGSSTMPGWLQDTINAIKSRPVTNPAESIISYTYNGATVYYRPPICCDIFSDLYDADGNVICHPDGGFAGSGDGACPGFLAARTNGKLIWQDPR